MQMSVRSKALWTGWVGTALSMASWLAIGSLSSRVVAFWVAMMAAGAVMCVYGAVRRSRWFLVPAIATLLITAGVIWMASRLEP